MIRIYPVLGALLITGLSAPVLADEIRLADGRVLIGTVRTVGDQVRIRTRTGETVIVAASEVVRIRSDDELRTELRRLAGSHGGPAHAELELAKMAWRSGLADEMWTHVDACLEAGADGTVRARLDSLLSGVGTALVPAHRMRAEAKRKVRALLDRVRSSTSPGRVAAVEAVLAGLQEEGVDEQLRIRARAASNPLQRQAALRILARRGTEHRTFVWRTAVLDPAGQVRTASMQIARDAGQAEAAVDYLAPGLVQPDGRIRIRTADAFADLGSPAGIAPLVAAGPLAAKASVSPGATRAHVAFLNQQSYVRDFDVEVAMASFIADPQVDAVQSGVVLDVTVAAIIRMRTQIVGSYRRAIAALAKDDPGPDPETWAEWFEARPEFPIAVAKADEAIARFKARPAPKGPAGPVAGGGGAGKGGAGKGGAGKGGAGKGAEEGGGIGIPILPGTLPPMPGTTFPPTPPRPTPPPPAARPGRGR